VIFKLDYFYILLGLVLAIVACMSFRDKTNPRRFTTGSFWALYAVVYLVGARLPPVLAGVIVIVMVLIAGLGGLKVGRYGTFTEQERRDSARKLGNRLFLPALTIPITTMIGSLVLKNVKIGNLFLLDPKNVTLVSLGFGCVFALIAACWLTGGTPVQAIRESRRLIDSMGWAVLLPHLLAVLGLLFTAAGVGKAVAFLATAHLPMDSRFISVAVYCIGMAIFTMIMGNAFAAFPVITGGVGVPVLIGVFHGNPAVMASIGMFSGYCGTLMTPMAANFNLVPAALLELPDKNAVIKAQVLTALPLLAANIGLMYFLMFR
jgi:uncharacterized membrane protein